MNCADPITLSSEWHAKAEGAGMAALRLTMPPACDSVVRWRFLLGLAVWLVIPAPTARCLAEQPESEQAERLTSATQGVRDSDAHQAQLTGKPALSDALEKMNAVLQAEANLSPEFKKAFSELLAALREETTSVSPQVQREELKSEVLASLAEQYAERDRTLAALGAVFDKLDVYGDLRLRHETDNNVDRRSTRNRERVRLRLGVIYQVSDELDIGARIVTGNDTDSKSSHQTFGSGFDSFEVSLDRAYATYRPQRAPGLSITAGKFAHPFRRNPVYGELVWDADIQPEGASMSYSLSGGGTRPFDRLDFTIGEYILLQQDDLDEASVFVAQIAGERALTTNLNLLAALAWYRYTDLTPDDDLSFLIKNAGNSIVGDEFVSDFSIFNPMVALTYKGLPRPLTLSGELMFNTRAEHGRGEGWALGLAYGETRRPKDWRAYYQFQYIEQDAVVSALSQDDFTLATNFRGHAFGVQYQLSDAVGLHLWALLAERLSSDSLVSSNSGDDQWRVRLDLNIRF